MYKNLLRIMMATYLHVRQLLIVTRLSTNTLPAQIYCSALHEHRCYSFRAQKPKMLRIEWRQKEQRGVKTDGGEE